MIYRKDIQQYHRMFRQVGKLLTRYRQASSAHKAIALLVPGALLVSSYAIYRTMWTETGSIVRQIEQFERRKAEQPSQIEDPQEKTGLQTNTLRVPSTLQEQQLELLGKVFPHMQIKSSEGTQNTIICRNSIGQQAHIQVVRDQLISDDWIFRLSNFNVLPHTTSKQQLDNILKGLLENQNIILMSLPPGDEFGRHEKEYRELKQKSTSSYNTYIVIRDQELANQLDLIPGNICIINKRGTDKGFTYQSESFHKESIPQSQSLESKRQFILNNTLETINVVYSDIDLDNFIRSMKASPSQIVMAASLDGIDAKNLEVMKAALQKFKKELRTDVHFLISRCKGLLQKRLNIQDDKMSLNIRVFDFGKKQAVENIFQGFKLESLPLTPTGRIVSRYIYDGQLTGKAFEEYLKDPKQHYQQKTLKNIEPITNLSEDVEGLVVIFKQECVGCILVSRILENIQQVIQELNEGGPRSQELIDKNNITNVQKFRRLKIYRYHILNQQASFPLDVSYTPQIHYLSEGKDKVIRVESTTVGEAHVQIIKKLCQHLS